MTAFSLNLAPTRHLVSMTSQWHPPWKNMIWLEYSNSDQSWVVFQLIVGLLFSGASIESHVLPSMLASSSPSSSTSSNNIWTLCSDSRVQNSIGKQHYCGNCLNMTKHHVTRGFPMVWPWHGSMMGSTSITALLESTNARTKHPSMVTICTAWDFLQGLHAFARRAVASFPLPLTTERVSSICSISSAMLAVLWESWLWLMFFMSMATLLTKRVKGN